MLNTQKSYEKWILSKLFLGINESGSLIPPKDFSVQIYFYIFKIFLYEQIISSRFLQGNLLQTDIHSLTYTKTPEKKGVQLFPQGS